jgi:hypothetical protein
MAFQNETGQEENQAQFMTQINAGIVAERFGAHLVFRAMRSLLPSNARQGRHIC